MNKDIAEKWIADLRTPGLKQASGRLFDGEGYCCLGRLCVVMGETFIFDIAQEKYVVNDGSENGEVLPDKIKIQTGMKSDNGSIPYNEPEDKRFFINKKFGSLASANDDGVSFLEIADWIEKNYEKL